MRVELRHRLEFSPVMNARQFARGLEAAYANMWRTWCEAQS
jgi:predicted O-linked N-acetylglucosamine transferase (SPINDLY family)